MFLSKYRAVIWRFLVAGVALATSACSLPPIGLSLSERRSSHPLEQDAFVSAREVDEGARTISFEASEGTRLNVDVSPDNNTIVFDLLGDLYLIPIEGGEAVQLTSGIAWDRGPRFSQDGEQIYFISDREGYKNVWRVIVSNGSVENVTNIERDIVGDLTWSSCGTTLIAGVLSEHVNAADVVLSYIDPESGLVVPVDPEFTSTITYSVEGGVEHDTRMHAASGTGGVEAGAVFFSWFTRDDALGVLSQIRSKIYRWDLRTGSRSSVTAESASYSEYSPLLSPDGVNMAYFRQYDDRRTELRLLNLVTREDRVLSTIYNEDDAFFSHFSSPRSNYSFNSNGDAIFYWRDGQISRVDTRNAHEERVPFLAGVERRVRSSVRAYSQSLSAIEQALYLSWPRFSNDRNFVVFATAGYIWSKSFVTGEVRQLTGSDEFAFTPSLSPDGTQVAYISYDAGQVAPDLLAYSPERHQPQGTLKIVDVENRVSRHLLSEPGFSFLRPSWSSDGSRLAVARMSEGRRPRTFSIGWADVQAGRFETVVSDLGAEVGGVRFPETVQFDPSGETLLITYTGRNRMSAIGRISLEGEAFELLAIGAADVRWISASPDLSHLLLTRRDYTSWLVPFRAQSQPVAVTTYVPGSFQIGEHGEYYHASPATQISDANLRYVDWRNEHEFSVAFGNEVLNYDVLSGLGDTRVIEVPIVRPTEHMPVAYTGARLITLSDAWDGSSVIEVGDILVERGRIQAIGEAGTIIFPPNTIRIDLGGATVIPGLIDTHYHSGGMLSEQPPITANDQSAIRHGVTTAWTAMSNAPAGWQAAYADYATAGRFVSPRWSYSEINPSRIVEFPDLQSAEALHEQAASLGTSVIKEYGSPTRAVQRLAAEAARNQGLGIVSHLDRFDDMMTRIVDGYTGGEHPTVPEPRYMDMRMMLIESGFIWTPDLNGVVGSTSQISLTSARYFCWELMTAISRGEIAGAHIPSDRFLDCEGIESAPQIPFETIRAARLAQLVAALQEEGALIGVTGHNFPAYNLHISMWMLNRGGMSVEDVLHATSLVNAEKLGLQDEIGSLEVGKVADFVVLNGNPLDNILNTMSTRYTVQFGRIYDADTAERVDAAALATTLH